MRTRRFNANQTLKCVPQPLKAIELIVKESNAMMKRSALGAFVAWAYPHLPLRGIWLRVVTKLEGGQIFSVTLREVLRKHYGVDAGFFSYGSLLVPGRAARHTKIGPYASIGPNVRRIGASHPTSALSMHPFWYESQFGFVGEEQDVERHACEIGPDVWIGANVTILPKCKKIGIGAVVGAGSVVTRNVQPFEIVAGNPARPLGTRLTTERQKYLLDSEYWKLGPSDAFAILQSIDD